MNRSVLMMSAAALLLGGCHALENQFREDGPAARSDWRTPTEIEIREEYAPAPQEQRGWEPLAVAPADGRVTHFPLHFEDPFEDKGPGDPLYSYDLCAPDEVFEANGCHYGRWYPRGRQEYRLGWEDVLAGFYSPARYGLNLVAYPVSLVVTPPWTLMESDGRISRQALGYDHDATRADPSEALPVPPGMAPPALPAATPEATATTAAPPPPSPSPADAGPARESR